MNLNIERKAGFTLVEIMIVVATIGLLASIAVPSFVKAREMSRSNVCIANLKQIRDVKVTWAMEHKKTATDTPDETDLFGANTYIRYLPECPGGGDYEIGSVDAQTTCSLGAVEGHTL